MLLYQLDYSISWATLWTGPLYQLGHSINRATLSTGPLYQPRHSINRATLLTGLLYQLSHSISWATLSIGTILTTRPLLLPHLYSETSPTAKIKDLFFQTGKFPVQTGFPPPPKTSLKVATIRLGTSEFEKAHFSKLVIACLWQFWGRRSLRNWSLLPPPLPLQLIKFISKNLTSIKSYAFFLSNVHESVRKQLTRHLQHIGSSKALVLVKWSACSPTTPMFWVPSCRLGLESQAHHLRFYQLQYNLCYICRVKRTKIKRENKEAGFGPFKK